ncbi:MAG: F0F1 ATP synthase subunit B [Bacillota bacterium]
MAYTAETNTETIAGSLQPSTAPAHEATANPVSPEPLSWIWIFINLIVILVVLRKLLWKPVTAFLEKRTNSISETITNAQKQLSEAETLKKEYHSSLNNARIEAAKIIEDSRKRAQQEYNGMLEAASKDAEAFKAKTRKEIAHEREEMLSKLKSEIAGLALHAASKVIEANMDTESNREFVNKIIDKEGVA